MTEEDEQEIPTLTASPDAETTILFTSHPEQGIRYIVETCHFLCTLDVITLYSYNFSEIAAGSIVDCLVGFTNNGKNDFIIDAMDASLRYPQDYSYFIQNVSMLQRIIDIQIIYFDLMTI